jgi:hypothetical protein
LAAGAGRALPYPTEKIPLEVLVIDHVMLYTASIGSELTPLTL